MMSKPRPNPMPLLIASMLLILPSLVYMALRAEMPGDGALLNLMGAVPGGSGLLIEDASGASSGLQDGDHLLAINGQSIDEWLESAWAFQGQTLAGENLRYTVSRAGELLTLQVRLERTDFIAQLGDNWASYLFLTYLLAVSAFTYYLKPDVPATRALLIASAAICASGLAFFTGLQATDVIRVWPFWIFIWGSIVIYALSMAAIGQFSLSFPRPRRILSERPRIAWLIFLALANTRVGTQPSLVHVPPIRSRSTSATEAPSSRARSAAVTPAGPPPMTMTSKSFTFTPYVCLPIWSPTSVSLSLRGPLSNPQGHVGRLHGLLGRA